MEGNIPYKSALLVAEDDHGNEQQDPLINQQMWETVQFSRKCQATSTPLTVSFYNESTTGISIHRSVTAVYYYIIL